ncbi:hypothetical protein CRV08_12660 [Halarcobacter ebronensis]|uniref:Lipoprotein n=1 Tax=Halarcobacter ebronensis TaxID=1462615 RepID=A0A4Q0YAB3_9BACT|nr:hypothetical protein [Halarcobacter ebronensis]RXJ66464.1 hypothetical protein CRV08_12660 [Halarcobacter ebronensis]
MSNIFRFVLLISIIFLENISANIDKKQEEVKKDQIIVGYYGRPNTKSLGILGQSNIDELVQKMKEKAKYFEKELDNKVEVKMAFHIIYGLATSDAGSRDTYMLRLSEKSLMPYIKRAQEENFEVIIDLQMGSNTPVEAITPVLKYLKYDHVHLAIDPEFKIPKHKKYPPGKFIGHIYAQDLNDAQELISNYINENHLENKLLIVHMFHDKMLREKDKVKKFDNIKLVYNIDGHGAPAVKIKIYNSIYSEEQTTIADSGFKIFYNNDTKIMTPKQILGWESTKGKKIQRQPFYINYQ